MKNLEIKYEVADVNLEEGTFVLTTTIKTKYNNDDALKELVQVEQESAKKQMFIKSLQKAIEDKKWIEDEAKAHEEVDNFNRWAGALNEGLKPYNAVLLEKGMNRVRYLKNKDSYDRIPADNDNKRTAIRNEILVKVMNELKLPDVQHPVMAELRYKGFSEDYQAKESQVKEEDKNGSEQ